MEQAPKPQRGGAHEALPTFTLKFYSYSKHNPALKSGKERSWVSFCRNIAHDPKVVAMGMEAVSAFLLLVAGSKEGALTNITVKDMAILCHRSDLRQMRRCLLQIGNSGLASFESEFTLEFVCEAKPPQRRVKATPKPPQSHPNAGSKQIALVSDDETEDFATGNAGGEDDTAALMRAGACDRDMEGREGGIRAHVSPDDFADQPEASPLASPTSPDPLKLIADAMAAAAVPVRHIDPPVAYRAKAQGFLNRKPSEIDAVTWATWVCSTIAAGGNCDDWEVRANTGLQECRAAGVYMAPEPPTPSKFTNGGGRTTAQKPVANPTGSAFDRWFSMANRRAEFTDAELIEAAAAAKLDAPKANPGDVPWPQRIDGWLRKAGLAVHDVG